VKFLKAILVLFIVYVGIVITFESLLGYFQPSDEDTLVITTTDNEGEQHDRVISELRLDGRLYVAANHWPRMWYWRMLEHPEVQITRDGKTAGYRAVPVRGEEYERVDEAHELGPVIRFLTGFPPRRIVRLEPLRPEGGERASDAGRPASRAQRAGAGSADDAMLRAISGRGGEPTGAEVGYFEADPKTTGYLAMPEGDGPFPAVILIHEWDGLVKRIKQTADAFAEQGYVALAADLYQGRTGSSPEENMALVREARSDEQAIIDNLNAAVAYVREETPTTGKVAAIGWCFGGGVALSYALGSDQHDGTAIFYGQLLDDPDRLAAIEHEVYGTFAGQDENIPPKQVHAFVDALREAGVNNDVHVYDAVDHGFWLYVDRAPTTNRGPAEDAWRRLQGYLNRVL